MPRASKSQIWASILKDHNSCLKLNGQAQDHQIWLRTFYLWVISYGLSFARFARFPEFRGTINDSFSSTCTNTYQHSTSYKEISVPMMCLDCKSLLGNTKEQTQAPWQYTDHWTRYSLKLWTAEAVINRASELWKSGNPENDSP